MISEAGMPAVVAVVVRVEGFDLVHGILADDERGVVVVSAATAGALEEGEGAGAI